LKEDSTFEFNKANLPIRIILAKYLSFQRDKLKTPEFFCWPGMCATSHRSPMDLDHAMKLFDEQRLQNLPVSAELVKTKVSKINLDIEMETGKGIPVERTHSGYFSIDKRTKKLVDPEMGKKATETDDVDAYDLILKDKERLLSLSEPVRFIFSHSALREGWDNPNVFVICALKHSDNTISRRQEVGRGLRLSVNQFGDRMDHPSIVHDINVLTVVASESYKDFVGALQKDISESLSARPRVADKAYFIGNPPIFNAGYE